MSSTRSLRQDLANCFFFYTEPYTHGKEGKQVLQDDDRDA